MLRKTLEISSPGTRLSVRNAQLLVQRREMGDVTVPIEDIGVLIIDDSQAVHTQAVFREILAAGGTVLVTDQRHMPAGMVLPLEGHHAQTGRHHAQIAISKPRRKRLWQQIVRAKIRLQSDLLKTVTGQDAGLTRLATRVRSGDPENLEAQAAQRYWPRLLGKKFRRDRETPGANALLNYGYAIIRAATARALVASGLIPSFGIHHRNQRNPFCLADDLMEPYRPLVDARVYMLFHDPHDTAGPEVRSHRADLLSIFNQTILFGEQRLPVLVAIERSAATLAAAMESTKSKLELPASLALGDPESDLDHERP